MSDKNRLFLQLNKAIRSINYVYFGVYFFLFASLQVSFVFLIAPKAKESLTYIYAFYAVLQAFVEVLFMALISGYLLAKKQRRFHSIYIGITVLFLLARGIDFVLVRLMDLSVWYGMSLFLQESFTNFVEILDSSSISITVWVMGLAVLSALFCSGVVLFSLLERVSRAKPLSLSFNPLFAAFMVACFGLVGADIYLHFEESRAPMERYTKALPWKRTLVPFDENVFTVSGYLADLSKESPLQKADSTLFSLERKPDLFLFITESLRHDFLTEETTPALFAFKNEHTEFAKVFSPANATQISWFSTFYSMHPFYWASYKEQEEKTGSHSMALLKKLGYEVHVYSASSLGFYSMDEVLFGKEGSLVDTLEQVRTDTMTPWEADKEVIERVCKKVTSDEKSGGRVFVMFLDSTHFDYSWPEEKTYFSPIHEKMNYLKLAGKRKNLDKVKNRYKNSLHFVDDLFGSFQKTMQDRGIWDESVVVFTADHGEEFDEEGNMFHASKLSAPQIQVPLYIKLPNDTPTWQLHKERLASQIDIFPTFFHYITGAAPEKGIFQGESLFSEDSKRSMIGGRYSASRPPEQFYIQNGPYRIVLDFCNCRDIFHCNKLRVDSIYNEQGEEVEYTPSFVEIYFQKSLDELFYSAD